MQIILGFSLQIPHGHHLHVHVVSRYFKDKIPFHITESGALVGGGLRVNDCPSEWLLGSPPVFQEEGC